MQHRTVEFFRPQVNAVLSYFYSQKALPKDDLEQEMWLKILEIFPKLKTIPEHELQPYVFTALRNQVRGLIRKHKNSPVKISTEASIIRDFEVTFDDYMDSLMLEADMVLPNSAEMEHMGKEMEKSILQFIETLSPSKQKVLKGLIWPDFNITKRWIKLQEENPMYRQFVTPPANTIGKMLGVSNVTTAKAVNALKTYMRCAGYA